MPDRSQAVAAVLPRRRTAAPVRPKPTSEQERFWRSNIHLYLCEPLGHHYSFDVRVEAHGVGRAVCCMWRGAGQPFGAGDIERARPLQRAWQRLFERERADARWVAVAGGTGEMVTDAAGERFLAINPAADRY